MPSSPETTPVPAPAESGEGKSKPAAPAEASAPKSAPKVESIDFETADKIASHPRKEGFRRFFDGRKISKTELPDDDKKAALLAKKKNDPERNRALKSQKKAYEAAQADVLRAKIKGKSEQHIKNLEAAALRMRTSLETIAAAANKAAQGHREIEETRIKDKREQALERVRDRVRPVAEALERGILDMKKKKDGVQIKIDEIDRIVEQNNGKIDKYREKMNDEPWYKRWVGKIPLLGSGTDYALFKSALKGIESINKDQRKRIKEQQRRLVGIAKRLSTTEQKAQTWIDYNNKLKQWEDNLSKFSLSKEGVDPQKIMGDIKKTLQDRYGSLLPKEMPKYAKIKTDRYLDVFNNLSGEFGRLKVKPEEFKAYLLKQGVAAGDNPRLEHVEKHLTQFLTVKIKTMYPGWFEGSKRARLLNEAKDSMKSMRSDNGLEVRTP
ncbi:MAG: hypothetical protein WCO03_00385 [bacterium]